MARTARSLPLADEADALPGLVREGYDYAGNRCERLGSDVFGTRLLGSPVICMRGAEAAALFYDQTRFTRRNAMPSPALRLLQDIGSVATLDDEAHHHRKRMFLSLMGEDGRARMAAIFVERWRARLCPARTRPEVALHDEARQVLCESVHAWCGIELPPDHVAIRTERLAAMVDGAASLGPRHWRARFGRRRLERGLAAEVAGLRRRGQPPDGSDPLHAVAFHRDAGGNLLDSEIAAVELINLLRPIVAIARFVAFAAHALAANPEAAGACRSGEAGAVERFVREVRRFYPFFPMAAGRVRHDFVWRGIEFRKGRRVLMDLYGTDRHPALWPEPDRFDPGRHLHRAPTPFDLIPQGGGDHETGHRCAGEWMTIRLTEEAVRLLAREMEYQVPPESLEIDRRIPAQPANGFVIRNLRGVPRPSAAPG